MVSFARFYEDIQSSAAPTPQELSKFLADLSTVCYCIFHSIHLHYKQSLIQDSCCLLALILIVFICVQEHGHEFNADHALQELYDYVKKYQDQVSTTLGNTSITLEWVCTLRTETSKRCKNKDALIAFS